MFEKCSELSNFKLRMLDDVIIPSYPSSNIGI
jgi:hypothetical protein